jgi:hypothetical protein
MGIMKYIKLIIISVVFLSVLVTGISLLFPSKVIASRAIEVNTNADNIAYFLYKSLIIAGFVVRRVLVLEVSEVVSFVFSKFLNLYKYHP